MEPLKGLTFLDLTLNLPGPFCSFYLEGLGAKVVKIEPPEGDPAAFYPPFVNGKGAVYELLNAKKEIRKIDLKSDIGKKEFEELVKQSDGLIEGFRPKKLDELGFPKSLLRTLNSKLIILRIVGFPFGSENYFSPSHDLNYLASTGLLDQIHPKPYPFLLGDIAGGSLSSLSSLFLALYHREKTGEALDIELSMAKICESFLVLEEAYKRANVKNPKMLEGTLPQYRIYKTKDDRYMALAALEPKFWKIFLKTIKKDETTQTSELEKLFATKTQNEWSEIFKNVECCCTPVLSAEEALSKNSFSSNLLRFL